MSTSRPTERRPRLLISSGEPAGIGPDLCLMQALREIDAAVVVLADPALLAQRRDHLGLAVDIELWQPRQDLPLARPGHVLVWPRALAVPCSAGQLDARNAAYVLAMLADACDACRDGLFDALVTAPVQKSILDTVAQPFSGHTEFFQHRCQVEQVVMMLVGPKLRVALATTHLPLRAVADAITPAHLTAVLRILDADLRTRFGLSAPRIAVCGLNPHAGEAGHLGDEEITVITPVIRALQQQGLQLTGPLPADTVFTPHQLARYDAVLAMYHDQGLPVLKHATFGAGVNITLGLPIVRTSVDHGTALDLAASGKADVGSLHAAMAAALDICQARSLR